MLTLLTCRRLVIALLLSIAGPASAQFLEIDRNVHLGVLDAFGLTGLFFNSRCADPWDGEEIVATCTWTTTGNLVCPPVQEDPPRGSHLNERWNRFIACFGGNRLGDFWVRGPANSCRADSGALSFWSRNGTGADCCEPTRWDSDGAHPEGCFPNSVPNWGHHSAAVFERACEAAVAVRQGIALREPIVGFETMVRTPPEPGRDGDSVECRILKRDLHALMLARQPPARPLVPPGLDAHPDEPGPPTPGLGRLRKVAP